MASVLAQHVSIPLTVKRSIISYGHYLGLTYQHATSTQKQHLMDTLNAHNLAFQIFYSRTKKHNLPLVLQEKTDSHHSHPMRTTNLCTQLSWTIAANMPWTPYVTYQTHKMLQIILVSVPFSNQLCFLYFAPFPTGFSCCPPPQKVKLPSFCMRHSQPLNIACECLWAYKCAMRGKEKVKLSY